MNPKGFLAEKSPLTTEFPHAVRTSREICIRTSLDRDHICPFVHHDWYRLHLSVFEAVALPHLDGNGTGNRMWLPNRTKAQDRLLCGRVDYCTNVCAVTLRNVDALR